ncbi:MAG: hypothetical protein ACRERU_19085 [Methylococcales bacterium]
MNFDPGKGPRRIVCLTEETTETLYRLGEHFQPEQVKARPGWEKIPAVRSSHLYEVKSSDILQPGPAALTDGVRQIHAIVLRWLEEQR